MEGNFIRLRRQRLGLTQDDIAAQLGIDRAAVAQWESGKTMPRSSRLIELSQILQCSVADIISNGKFNLPQYVKQTLKINIEYEAVYANLQVRNEALQEEIGIVNIQMGNKNKVTIDSKITNDSVIILIRENIINEEVNLVKLRQTRQDTHKDVVESKEKIDAMYNALDQETLAVAESGIIPVSSIHKELMLQKYQTMTKLNVNVAVESEIRALLAMKEKELDELSSDMREYVMLSRQINIKRNLHNVMSEGVEWVKMFKEWKHIYVAIIDEADTPKSDKPASPNIIIVIAMGSVIGLAVCILSCVRKW